MAQSLPPGSPRVLCISSDILLLSTRRMVLSLRYRTMAVSSMAEMQQLAGEPFDAVVVCHTLRPEECSSAIQVALQQWPRAEVIVLARAEGTCVQGANRVVRSGAGPEFLLNALDRLFQTRGIGQVSPQWTPAPQGSGTAVGRA